MLQTESQVIIADNSGAKIGQIIRILKGSNAKKATIGDKVVIAIKDVASTSSFKKGDVSWALIVRTRKEIRRSDGTYVRFADNAVALIEKDPKGEIKAVGKRIFGPVAKELRDKGYKHIATLAEEVI